MTAVLDTVDQALLQRAERDVVSATGRSGADARLFLGDLCERTRAAGKDPNELLELFTGDGPGIAVLRQEAEQEANALREKQQRDARVSARFKRLGRW